MNEEQTAELIEAIRQQIDAINRLASSNAALVQAMAEAEVMDDEERESTTYLDGSTLD
ncbi:hypothetical protein NUW46_04960 [Marinobacter sp. MA]|uniref:hypothetical protein n=1 Tax=Marinobacter sp. MA TaxID=2971606 RepID=UPI003AB02BC8